MLHTLRLSRKHASIGKAVQPFSTTAPRGTEIKNLTVVGAGLMGSGIAQVAAQAGIKVTVHALNRELSDNSHSIINQSLTRIAKKRFPESPSEQTAFVQSVHDNLTFTNELKLAVVPHSPDLIIEAIVEQVHLKQELFNSLHHLLSHSPDTLFASNTSSLKISDISRIVPPERQQNPVPQMKLVEVIKTDQTSDSTIDKLIEFSKVMGKTPVRCTDTPGFIVNRLLVPYLMEAMRMIERGEASKEDIDTAMKLGAGHPMGPIELADYVGLDTMKFISDGWRESRVSSGEMDENLVKPVPTLDRLVEERKLGRKTKQGFFKY